MVVEITDFGGDLDLPDTANEAVRSRLEAMDQVYQHMLDATTRALNEWRSRRGKSATQPPSARSR